MRRRIASNAAHKFRIAGHRAGAQQRLMLPGPGVGLLISLERIDAGHEKAAFAVRPQTHVHLIEAAGGGMHGEQVHDALAQTQKENAVVERLFAVGQLDAAARIVQKNQIQIRGVAQFQAAELAVSRDGHHDAAQPLPGLRRSTAFRRHASSAATPDPCSIGR